MADRDTDLLARAAANHLFLGQFEAFRAIILSLRARNPDLARAILQAVVSRGGRLDNVLWSRSCSSPSILAYLSSLELLQFNDASSIWSFDRATMRLRVEFLLYVQMISSRVSGSLQRVDELESGDLKDDLKEVSGVLGKLSDLGVNRLKPDLVVRDERESAGTSEGEVVLEEEELMGLRRVILDNADVFDVLCRNIEAQVEGVERDDSGLAITLRREEKQSDDDDVKLLKLIQRCVQIAHLDAMRECFKEFNEEGVLSHIRFLHLDYGVEESEYRYELF
ncbi:hypothetical protein Acr_20g0002390 [Actinidia rufa]|uniref:Uncharacterized protein n=1 Tax=Actinidia rufa TaxID=165716 RepID=A0A7J0GCD9_9ERIC|nr:hypothetical protein Acr_20g0002390 [Actinidia rufa]